MVSPASQAASDVAPLTPPSGRGGGRFLTRTLRELTGGLEATLAAEETVRLPGLLQTLDPRGKVFWFLGLLLATAFARHLGTLLALCMAAHLIARLGRLPWRFFFYRVWLFVPFFSVVVALPAVLNVFTPGKIVLPLVDLGRPFAWGFFSLPAQIGISEQGLRGAGTLILRVATSVALAVLLVSTTRWASLLHALEALRLPRSLVLILGMTYRYIILFLRTAGAMFLARESRRVGRLPRGEGRRLVAGAAGALLGKSYHLSNEVYLAMLSRGFRGDGRLQFDSAEATIPARPLAGIGDARPQNATVAPTLAGRFSWRGRDWLAGAATAVVAGAALLLDRILG